MNDITVLTIVENDIGLFDLMARSVFKFIFPLPKMVICDQGRNGNILDKYKDNPNITIIQNNPKLKLGSNRHGEGIEFIKNRIKTSYSVIIESDCVVLANLREVDLGNKKALLAKKADSLYHICFAVLPTKILQATDMRPGKKGTRLNRPYKINEDVGWMLKNNIKPEEIKFMDFVDCKTDRAQIWKGFQSDEFVLDGEVICGHFGRGSNICGKAIRPGFKSHSEQLARWKKIVEEILK